MSQVTGLIPGMKREEEVPDVAPQEGEYQEYTVGQEIFSLSLSQPNKKYVKLSKQTKQKMKMIHKIYSIM